MSASATASESSLALVSQLSETFKEQQRQQPQPLLDATKTKQNDVAQAITNLTSALKAYDKQLGQLQSEQKLFEKLLAQIIMNLKVEIAKWDDQKLDIARQPDFQTTVDTVVQGILSHSQTFDGITVGSRGLDDYEDHGRQEMDVLLLSATYAMIIELKYINLNYVIKGKGDGDSNQRVTQWLSMSAEDLIDLRVTINVGTPKNRVDLKKDILERQASIADYADHIRTYKGDKATVGQGIRYPAAFQKMYGPNYAVDFRVVIGVGRSVLEA